MPLAQPQPQPQPLPQPEPQPEKWNPGIYIQSQEGRHGNKFLDATNRQKRQNFWARYSNEPAIKGFVFVGEWGLIQQVDGNYDNVNQIISDMDFLASQNTKKMYMLQMRTQAFGSGSVDACPEDDAAPSASNVREFPRWLWATHTAHAAHSDVCANANAKQAVLRLWDTQIEADYTIFLQQLGERLDPHPNFEGIIINHESATGSGLPGSPDSTYDKDDYREALKRIAAAAKAAFPRSNVVLNVNYKMGNPVQGTMDALVAWAQTNGIGLGGPDTAPMCTNVDPQSTDVADSYCVDGFADASADEHGIPAHNSMVNDPAAGQIPIMMRYAADQMGGGARVGNDAGYHPTTIERFWNELQTTHGYVIWNSNDSYTYTWADDVYPWIQNNPNMLQHIECPASQCR